MKNSKLGLIALKYIKQMYDITYKFYLDKRKKYYIDSSFCL